MSKTSFFEESGPALSQIDPAVAAPYALQAAASALQAAASASQANDLVTGGGSPGTAVKNILKGQYIGAPVSAFGAKNDSATNNARYIADAAAYAQVNRLGLLFDSGGGYATTPIQFGGANPTTGTVKASISGNTLTVDPTGGAPGIPLTAGQWITGPGVTECNIVAPIGSACGWLGSYTIDGAPQTVASVTMTVSAPSFTATITGDQMAATVSHGKLQIHDAVVGGGTITGTTITAQLSGTAGLSGTYRISYTQAVANAPMRAYPLTVVPLPNFIMGAPGGQTQTVIFGAGETQVFTPLIKIVNPPALGAVLGFEIGNLRISASNVYGNALQIHGFSATTAGGIPRVRDITVSGAWSPTGGMNVIGNNAGGSGYQVVEAVFSRIEGVGNTVTDFNFDGDNGDGSYNIQSVVLESLKANSASSGDGARFNYANVFAPSLLSQNHAGNSVYLDHCGYFEAPGFYSEGNGGPFTSTANSRFITLSGSADEGVNALTKNSTSNIKLNTGAGTVKWTGAQASDGGTVTGLAKLGVRSTGTGAFDLVFSNTENLTAERAFTVRTFDANRTLTMAGDVQFNSGTAFGALSTGDIWAGSGPGLATPLPGNTATSTKLLSSTGNGSAALMPSYAITVSTDGTFASNSDTNVPSEKAARTYVDAKVAALVASSPALLDTLKELADAIGDDPNFATTMANSLALKAPLASPALSGAPTTPTAAAGTNTTQIASTAFSQSAVQSAAGTAAPLGPGTAAVGTSTKWAHEDHVHPVPAISAISGLGANVATFLATPSSANFAAALTDEDNTAGVIPMETSGTWTPVDASGFGPAFTLASGKWVRVGNLMHLFAKITYASSSDTHGAVIGGLPVAVPNQDYAEVPAFQKNNNGIGAPAVIVPVKNTSTLEIWTNTTAARLTNATMSGTTFSFHVVYPIT